MFMIMDNFKYGEGFFLPPHMPLVQGDWEKLMPFK